MTTDDFFPGSSGSTGPDQPHREHAGGMKRHAQLRGQPGLRWLWVGDNQDWEQMRGLPGGSLVCPAPGCGTRLTPVLLKSGTRFLRDMPGGSCAHPPVARPEGGGGPMSAQHLWLQSRILRTCEELGHEAIAEHYKTRADVYVPAAQLAIEVQRWSTDYHQRTEARRLRGARVLWLIPEQEGAPHTQSSRRALFTLPAACLKVHARGNYNQLLTPWLRRDQEDRAVLTVFATVARLSSDGDALQTGYHDFTAFLREVLAGSRGWYPPGTTGLPRSGGAWVRHSDLRQVRQRQEALWAAAKAAQAAAAAAAAQELAAAQEEASAAQAAAAAADASATDAARTAAAAPSEASAAQPAAEARSEVTAAAQERIPLDAPGAPDRRIGAASRLRRRWGQWLAAWMRR